MELQVPNWNNLVSKFKCDNFTWNIGGFEFSTAVRTLLMGGYDLVLGVVTFDYKKLTLQLQYKGKEITLQVMNNHSNPGFNKWVLRHLLGVVKDKDMVSSTWLMHRSNRSSTFHRSRASCWSSSREKSAATAARIWRCISHSRSSLHSYRSATQ